jgi:fructokinase
MTPKTQIVGIGEVLMDLFEDGSASIGGAPFNVAFQAHQLLVANECGQGTIATAVGLDDWGRFIITAVREAGMSTDHIIINPRYPTGIADVFVHAGEAGYDIPPDRAWDHLDADASLDELAAETSAVAFGSLAQRAAPSFNAIHRFIAKVAGPRLYDVNLRHNSTDGVKGYSAEIVHSSCHLATLVKCNVAELAEVYCLLNLPPLHSTGDQLLLDQMNHLRTAYGLQVVVVTRGARGALLRSATQTLQLPDSTLPLDSIHPVGAGDAFSAGLLYGLTRGLPLETTARLADRLASWVTGYASATPDMTPDLLVELRAIEASSSSALQFE